MADFKELERKISDLKATLDKVEQKTFALERKTGNVTGDPIIQGYAGMRLTLNQSLNVLELLKRVQSISDATLQTAQTYTDTAKGETDTDLSAIQASITALATAVSNLQTALGNLYDNCTNNTLMKFNGTGADDSTITDDGSVVTIPSALCLKQIRTTSATYSVVATDYAVFCGTGCTAVNLPAGSSGRSLRIINCTAGDITIAPNGSELLDGVNAAKILSSGGVIDLIYNSTEGWR